MKIDVKAIRAQLEAATQWAPGKDRGAWRSEAIGSGYAVQRFSRGEYRDEDEWVNLGWVDPINRQPVFGRHESAFMVAARSDVPALCDRIEELEAALRGVLPLAKTAAALTSHPSLSWSKYDTAKDALGDL